MANNSFYSKIGVQQAFMTCYGDNFVNSDVAYTGVSLYETIIDENGNKNITDNKAKKLHLYTTKTEKINIVDLVINFNEIKKINFDNISQNITLDFSGLNINFNNLIKFEGYKRDNINLEKITVNNYDKDAALSSIAQQIWDYKIYSDRKIFIQSFVYNPTEFNTNNYKSYDDYETYLNYTSILYKTNPSDCKLLNLVDIQKYWQWLTDNTIKNRLGLLDATISFTQNLYYYFNDDKINEIVEYLKNRRSSAIQFNYKDFIYAITNEQNSISTVVFNYGLYVEAIKNEQKSKRTLFDTEQAIKYWDNVLNNYENNSINYDDIGITFLDTTIDYTKSINGDIFPKPDNKENPEDKVESNPNDLVSDLLEHLQLIKNKIEIKNFKYDGDNYAFEKYINFLYDNNDDEYKEAYINKLEELCNNIYQYWESKNESDNILETISLCNKLLIRVDNEKNSLKNLIDQLNNKITEIENTNEINKNKNYINNFDYNGNNSEYENFINILTKDNVIEYKETYDNKINNNLCSKIESWWSGKTDTYELSRTITLSKRLNEYLTNSNLDTLIRTLESQLTSIENSKFSSYTDNELLAIIDNFVYNEYTGNNDDYQNYISALNNIKKPENKKLVNLSEITNYWNNNKNNTSLQYELERTINLTKQLKTHFTDSTIDTAVSKLQGYLNSMQSIINDKNQALGIVNNFIYTGDNGKYQEYINALDKVSTSERKLLELSYIQNYWDNNKENTSDLQETIRLTKILQNYFSGTNKTNIGNTITILENLYKEATTPKPENPGTDDGNETPTEDIPSGSSLEIETI